MKVNVSVIVPIRNEEDNLSRCLKSISWADEIFVVDSHSQDRSVEIATAAGARVVQFDFSPPWPKKKNWALETLPFSHEWVLVIDADEELDADAEAEIREIVTNPTSDAPVGYWINRRFWFMGKWLKHSYYPNWNLRLFRHRLGRYEKLTDMDTASGDNEVHEHVVIHGRLGRLKSEMNHYAFPSVEAFIEKHNRYSNWEARVALSAGKSGHKQIRRYLRNLSRHLPFRPFLRFFYVYVLQLGFLDGIEGYYFARLHGVYELLIIAKTHELRRGSCSPDNLARWNK